MIALRRSTREARRAEATELGDRLRAVHGKERQIRELLEALIERADEPSSLTELEDHCKQALTRERRVGKRLKRYERRSRGGRGTQEPVRPMTVPSQAAHLPEHLDVLYTLLERLAEQAGDTKTAKIARNNRGTAQWTAKTISDSLDKVSNFFVPEPGQPPGSP